MKSMSWRIKGIYFFLCMTEIVLCMMNVYAFGTIFRDLAFWFVFLLFLIPFMPVSLFWDIRVLCAVKNDRVQRKKQFVLTIVSPIFYILSWSIACIVFVLSTGGV